MSVCLVFFQASGCTPSCFVVGNVINAWRSRRMSPLLARTILPVFEHFILRTVVRYPMTFTARGRFDERQTALARRWIGSGAADCTLWASHNMQHEFNERSTQHIHFRNQTITVGVQCSDTFYVKPKATLGSIYEGNVCSHRVSSFYWLHTAQSS